MVRRPGRLVRNGVASGALFAAVVLTVTGVTGVTVVACTSSAPAAARDADVDGTFGVSTRDAAGDGASDGRVDRLVYHGGSTLRHLRLRVVYIGEEGVDAAPNIDEFARWLVTSHWWGVLGEYGIDRGTLDASARIPYATMFPPESVVGGLISAPNLELRVRALLHPELRDGGSLDGSGGVVDAGTADASDGNASDGNTRGSDDSGSDDSGSDGAPASLIGVSDGYVFLLPNGVNVSLGTQGSRTFQTCIDAGGYHAHDGLEPFAVIPPCRNGRSALTLSHEISEMATNPAVVDGWFSDDEADRKLGVEIADVCNTPVPRSVDGWLVAQLWSNVEGRCIPL